MGLESDELYLALREVCLAIEDCGASVEITHANMLASEVMQAIGNRWNPPNHHVASQLRERLRISYLSVVLRVFPDAVCVKGDNGFSIMSDTTDTAIKLGEDTLELTAWYSARWHNKVRYPST